MGPIVGPAATLDIPTGEVPEYACGAQPHGCAPHGVSAKRHLLETAFFSVEPAESLTPKPAGI